MPAGVNTAVPGMMGYIYIFLTILFTVYGQIVLNWRISLKGVAPDGIQGKFSFLLNAYTDFYIITALMSAIIASVFWMLTLTKFQISYAYSFMSLCFPAVMITGSIFFGDDFTIIKMIGLLMIMFGVFLISKT